MKRNNYLVDRQIRMNVERIAGGVRSSALHGFDGEVKLAFEHKKEERMISTQEFKACIDELQNILKDNKNKRYEEILNVFNEIYEPVKTCKFLPAIRASQRILEVAKNELETDPKTLKNILVKCEKNIEASNKKEEIYKRKSEYLTRFPS